MADHSVQFLETTERSFTLKTGEFCLIYRLKDNPDGTILIQRDGAAEYAIATRLAAGYDLNPADPAIRPALDFQETSRWRAQPLPAPGRWRSAWVRRVQDDMEMAITLLGGAIRGAILLLDSNLRIWPDPALLAKFEPELDMLRARAANVRPAERIRP